MSLVTADLPSPEQMRLRWAAASAILTAMGVEDGATAAGSRWHHDDGGGKWCDLALLPGGRAVLFGHDHECSETYFRSAAAYAAGPHLTVDHLRAVFGPIDADLDAGVRAARRFA